MKVCMVGLGSIGRRHLRNLSVLANEKGLALTIDALRSHGKGLPEEEAGLLQTIYRDTGTLPDDYDIAFICNPTSMHYDTIQALAPKTKHMFIEKPVFDRTDYPINKIGLRDDGIYYVACPLRYTSVMQRIKEYVRDKHIYAVRAICSSYLPHWRPDMDYRKTYSAHKDMGGGVSLDLIHEWDYLCWLFGVPKEVKQMQGKYSALELDSEDISVYIARYPDKLVSLHLDYFGRAERREIELYMRDEVIVGDLRKQEIRFLYSGKTLHVSETRDVYQKRELACFLDMVAKKTPNQNDINTAIYTMKIALGGQ